MKRSNLVLALAGLTLLAQLASVDAQAQSAYERCRNRSSRTVGGAAAGAIVGGILGAVLGHGRGGNVAIGAGAGAVGGAVIRDANGADACRQVEMDREDREEARRAPDDPPYPGPRGGGVVIARFQFEQNFLRSYTQTYSDDQRLQMISDLQYDLERRGELLDGYDLYQIMVRIDGGRAQRLTANRAEVLRNLQNDVAGLNYDERSWIDGLFPNKAHPLYPEVASIISRLSY